MKNKKQLKGCYISDGRLHCNRVHVGDYCELSTPEEIKQYNEKIMSDYAKIKCVYLPDGRVIYPA